MTNNHISSNQIIQYLKNEPTLSLISGGLAGALSRTSVSPIERIKVIYQIQGLKKSYNNNLFKSIYQIWLEEGIIGLFRGNLINCIRIIPYSAIQYSVYQELKLKWKDRNNELGNGYKLIAGSIAGLMSVIITYPMDLIKTRLSIQTAKSLNLKIKKKLSVYEMILTIYKKEGGLKAFYNGLIPTSLGVAPYVALNFTIYENFKKNIAFENQSNPIIILILGALSGGIGQTIVYPMDILRRRFQIVDYSNKYNSILDALIKIYKNEGGLKGLYKGWNANMWKIMPSMAVQWASYDLIKKFINEL